MINFRRFSRRLDVLPIDTRDHITVSQPQFVENDIGLYAGNGYSDALAVFGSDRLVAASSSSF